MGDDGFLAPAEGCVLRLCCPCAFAIEPSNSCFRRVRENPAKRMRIDEPDIRQSGRAEELVVRSINDLTERHGFGLMASLRPPQFQLFSLNDDPDGLWVAEDAGQMLGFAFSWVCGDLWFLAELFVSPGNQGRGIGNEY